MKKYDSYAILYNLYHENYNTYIATSGLSYIPDFYLYSKYYKSHVVDSTEEYRPDKIAFNLWNNQKLTWVLNAINYFTHGIEEYYAGRSIYYLENDLLRNIGIV